jgi:hypothetical protein
MSETFMDQVLAGEAFLSDIDDFVDEWHDGDSEQSLHTYLGMDEAEYALWVERPWSLRLIVAARKQQQPVAEFARDVHEHFLAARGVDQDDADALVDWLRETGRLPSH